MKLSAVWPYIVQALAILGAAWIFSQSTEHRVSVLEANQITQTKNMELMQFQLREQERTLARLIALEEFLHGSGAKK